MAYEMNEAQTRSIDTDPAFGIAAYEGSIQEGCWEGLHVGVFGDLDDARRWLHGDDDTVQPMRVYAAR